MSSPRPTFFGLQDKARRKSIWLLSASFLLLWFAANVVSFVGYVGNTNCAYDSYGYETCDSSFVMNYQLLAITAVIVVVYLWIAYMVSGKAALSLAASKLADGPEY